MTLHKRKTCKPSSLDMQISQFHEYQKTNIQPYRENNDVGRFHWILGGQDDATMVDASLVIGVVLAAHGEVPLEQVILQRLREILRRRLGQLLRLPHQSLDG